MFRETIEEFVKDRHPRKAQNKSNLTLEIEKELFKRLNKGRVRVADEVPVSNRTNWDKGVYAGKVDMMTLQYDLKTIIIGVYEIKVSLNDLKSIHGKNFVGDENYWVLSKELYDEVIFKDLEELLGNDIDIFIYSKGRFYYKQANKSLKTSLRIGEMTLQQRFKTIDAFIQRTNRGYNRSNLK